jgi:hypothetical protein
MRSGSDRRTRQKRTDWSGIPHSPFLLYPACAVMPIARLLCGCTVRNGGLAYFFCAYQALSAQRNSLRGGVIAHFLGLPQILEQKGANLP